MTTCVICGAVDTPCEHDDEPNYFVACRNKNRRKTMKVRCEMEIEYVGTKLLSDVSEAELEDYLMEVLVNAMNKDEMNPLCPDRVTFHAFTKVNGNK
jgi:hypothetical protein